MKKEYKKFDMAKQPIVPKWYMKLLMIIVAFFFGGPFTTRPKFTYHNLKRDFKEPALFFSNHGSFLDFANMTHITFPHVPCYVSAVDEFLGREWIMRQVGCFPKRKFTTDLTVVKRINKLINKDKVSVCIYPEARWSIAGVLEDITESLGKMAKLCKCRIVVVNQKGDFLRSPQWNKHPYRKLKNYVDIYEVASKEEVINLDEKELQRRIAEKLEYDEYKWQKDNKIKITSKKRAENIHQILYKCTCCNHEGKMISKGTTLTCLNCNTKWEMDEYGLMKQQNNGSSRFELVSDWYRWERQECIKEVNDGTYYFEDDVRLERLINAQVQFKKVGNVKLYHDSNGFLLKGKLDDGSDFEMKKAPLSTSSIHIEYNYRKRGNCVDINDLEENYYAFPLNKGAIITKFNFATEAIFAKSKTNQ